jgi:hypothetical protein
MTKKKSKNPLATIAEGVSNAITAVALAPLFLITSLFDG